MPDFNYKGRPGTCLWCGKKIPEFRKRIWVNWGSNRPDEPLPSVGDQADIYDAA